MQCTDNVQILGLFQSGTLTIHASISNATVLLKQTLTIESKINTLLIIQSKTAHESGNI